MDSSQLHQKNGEERSEQPFAPAAGVVHALEERVSTVLCKCPLIHVNGSRPSNRRANRFNAHFQSFTGIVHVFAACSIARYTTFSAERSLGKIRRLLMALRITLFSDSMALVV